VLAIRIIFWITRIKHVAYANPILWSLTITGWIRSMLPHLTIFGQSSLAFSPKSLRPFAESAYTAGTAAEAIVAGIATTMNIDMLFNATHEFTVIST
jgi:hypothetical protein